MINIDFSEAFMEHNPNTLPQAIVDLAALTGETPEFIMECYIGTRNLLMLSHKLAVAGGWWSDLKTGERKDRNKGELLMLMVSEISEAMEAERKNLMDDKLGHRKGAEVELADAIIRQGDYAGGFGYDVAAAMIEKMVFNAKRADHKPENRMKEGGKAF